MGSISASFLALDYRRPLRNFSNSAIAGYKPGSYGDSTGLKHVLIYTRSYGEDVLLFLAYVFSNTHLVYLSYYSKLIFSLLDFAKERVQSVALVNRLV